MKIVLCDSNSINSYGFRTDVSGINLERFRKNPVMLYNHDPLQVIGKWDNVKVEKEQLTAEPVFDMEDPFAAEIARKVEDGFIKGCSMGLMIKEITKTKGIDTANESLLLEASIVSIPADENALVVYADEKQEKKLSINEFNKLFYNMETKDTKTIDNSQLTIDHSQLKIHNSQLTIENLQTELAAKNDIIADLSAQVDELKKDLAEREYHEAELAVDAAIQEGKISKEVKSIVLSFYLDKPNDTKTLLSALSAHGTAPAHGRDGVHERDGVHTVSTDANTPTVSLSAMVKKDGETVNRTWDELDKAGELKRLKEINPEEFRRLFFERFGTEYKEF